MLCYRQDRQKGNDMKKGYSITFDTKDEFKRFIEYCYLGNIERCSYARKRLFEEIENGSSKSVLEVYTDWIEECENDMKNIKELKSGIN